MLLLEGFCLYVTILDSGIMINHLFKKVIMFCLFRYTVHSVLKCSFYCYSVMVRPKDEEMTVSKEPVIFLVLTKSGGHIRTHSLTQGSTGSTGGRGSLCWYLTGRDGRGSASSFRID